MPVKKYKTIGHEFKGGIPRMIVKEIPPPPKLCKKCNKNPRRQASAYCGNCSLKYHSGL